MRAQRQSGLQPSGHSPQAAVGNPPALAKDPKSRHQTPKLDPQPRGRRRGRKHAEATHCQPLVPGGIERPGLENLLEGLRGPKSLSSLYLPEKRLKGLTTKALFLIIAPEITN